PPQQLRLSLRPLALVVMLLLLPSPRADRLRQLHVTGSIWTSALRMSCIVRTNLSLLVLFLYISQTLAKHVTFAKLHLEHDERNDKDHYTTFQKQHKETRHGEELHDIVNVSYF